jgi:predicted GNAT superfamily acetyltransferase
MTSIIAEKLGFIQMTEIELVRKPENAHDLARVLTEVWGGAEPIPPDVIIAIVHAGGYASLASQIVNGKKQFVGGSLAIVGNHQRKLHSHVTGVIDATTNTGVGRALKDHQWMWAKENEFSVISWTFDPLVRRNAHFNLIVLGAKVVKYCQNYYGEINDLINAGDQTDRLVVERQVDGLSLAPSGSTCVAKDGDLIIPTPIDIVGLRNTDRDASTRLRLEQRASFESAFANSLSVQGLTHDDSFVLTQYDLKIET